MRTFNAIDSKEAQDTIIKPIFFRNDSVFSPDTSAVKFDKDSISKITLKKAINIQTQIANSESVKTNDEPDYSKIELNNKSLIDNYLSTSWFNKNHDKIYYLFNKEAHDSKSSLIFIDTNSENTLTTSKIIAPKETPRQNTDWYMVPVFSGIILFAFAYNVYRKYFGQLYESVFFRFITKKLINDKNVTFQRFSVILDFLFIITFSLIIDQILLKLNIYVAPKESEFLLAFMVSITILSIKVLRFIIFRATSLITSQRIFLRDLYINSLIYTRVMGLILLPIVFL